ncbi:MAG: M1 family metallopeptidase, partial [Acidobacteria bacterium]|nr:M1 family metallopeptidase [Acidobacteriota bacterium]
MWRRFLTLAVGLLPILGAQERRGRIDVEHYLIEAEIQPRTQSLSATAAVRFTPLDDNLTSAVFELHNSLSVSKIVDSGGKQIPASTSAQDFTRRLTFDEPLKRSQPATVTFTYDGRLTGNEESPVYGIKFASIQNDSAYLLYPGRWFPVSGYTADRFSAELRISVPAGYRVLASGVETRETAADKTIYTFKFERSSFPGSLAVVREQATPVSSGGVTTQVYFRSAGKEVVHPYGEETGKIVSHFTSLFGLPPYANLALIETESGAPNGYSAPGLVFLSPRGIGKQPNTKLLANQISRQWWETLVSPASRNHLWLSQGLANYSELLYLEHSSGPGARDTELRDTMVEALTVDNVPIVQASRLEDYAPELWALVSSKGA